MGSAIGGALGARQERKAAKRARQRMDAQAAETRRIRDESVARLNPFAKAGETASGRLSALLTGQRYNAETKQMEDVSEQERADLFFKSPGYQFKEDEMLKATRRSQAARGELLGSRALAEEQDRQRGMLSQEYGSYLDRLTQLSGSGQNAATNQGSMALSGQGQVNTMANQAANFLMEQGKARASEMTNWGKAVDVGIDTGARLMNPVKPKPKPKPTGNANAAVF